MRAVAAQSIAVNASASANTNVAPGAKLTIPVVIDLANAAGINIASLQAGISWGTSALSFDSIRVAPATGWTTFVPNIAGAGGGSVSFSASRSTALPSSGTVANAFFTASAATTGTRVLITPTAAANASLQTILSALRPRALNVCVETPGAYGDVTGDGSVNIIDAQQIALFSVGAPVLSPPLLAARGDVTADASVNIVDAQQIALFSVGSPAAPLISSPAPMAAPATALGLTPSSSQNLFVNTSLQVLATPTAPIGDLTGCAPTVWGTSNSAVAVVNSSGFVTALGAGAATITATSGTITSQVSVNAALSPVASVSVSLGLSSIVSGTTTSATATTRDVSNIILTGRVIAWSSSNTAVASVNASTGVVTGVGAGTASIIATSEGIAGQAQVTVTPAPVPVASLSVTLAHPSLRATTPTVSTSTSTVVLKDASNNVLSNTGRVIVWSSSNPAKATVNSSTGLVTAVAPGQADIIATCEGVSALATVTVTIPPVATVSVSLASNLAIAAIATATATLRDSLNNVLTGRVITWSSSNTTIASVIATTGVVTAIANGTTNISATSETKVGTSALTVGATGEPSYVPGAGVTLVYGDNMERYTDATSMGAFPYKYTAPQFSPNPAPSQTSTPVDVTHVLVISPGRDGTGKALRLKYDGIYQESHNLAIVNVPPQPDTQTVYVQYYARVTPSSTWPLTQALAVKWIEQWHVHSQVTRIEFNTRYPSSTNTKQTAPTVWQVVDQGESPGNADQPLGPFFHQIADGQWHRFTTAFKPHKSSTVRDGFAKMWVDGTLIVDIETATIGVTPLGGVSPWCQLADVNNLATADGVAYLNFGGPQTTATGGWTFDFDDLLWWRQ